MKRCAIAVGLMLVASIDQSAFAQSGGSMLEEVIVTAQKRSQGLQDVPLAITAFTAGSVDKLRIGEFNDLAMYTPGLVSAPDFAFSERTSMRGLGSAAFAFGFDPHIGVFVNGVYQGRNGSQTSTLFDVERVEVVKGPVGALYGRSTIAGAINIINVKPVDSTEGFVDLELAERDGIRFNGVLNIPITDKLYFRGGIHTEQQDGYMENVVNGDTLGDTSADAVRLALRFKGERLDATLTASYEEREDQPNFNQSTASAEETTYFGLPLSLFVLDPTADLSLAGPFDDYDMALSPEVDPRSESSYADITLDLVYGLSDALSLKSLTNYRETDVDYVEDFDANALPDLTYFGPYGQTQDIELFQQEFQLSYQSEGGLFVLGGLSYYDESLEGTIYSSYSETLGLYSEYETQIQDEYGETEAEFMGWSAYIDVTLPIAERLEWIVGVRYAYDEKELTQYVPDPAGLPGNTPAAFNLNWPAFASTPVTNDEDWDDTTFRTSINYAVTEDINLYVSYAQGYKAGAIDSLSFEAPIDFPAFYGVDVSLIGGKPKSVDPESSDSYEVGLKSFLLDRELQLNLAAFYYEFEDQQQLIAQGASLIIENVGEVEGQGIEADIRWVPNENWNVVTSIAYLDTEIVKDEVTPENEGQPTILAPEWSGSAVITYSYPLSNGASLYSEVAYSYQGSMKVQQDPSSPEADSFDLINLRLGYDSTDQKWGGSVFVDNLMDELVVQSAVIPNGYGSPNILDTNRAISAPRTAGIKMYYRF